MKKPLNSKRVRTYRYDLRDINGLVTQIYSEVDLCLGAEWHGKKVIAKRLMESHPEFR